VTTEEVCQALANIADAPVITGRELFRWVTFGYLTCNGDMHAKNLAVGGASGWELARHSDLRRAVQLHERAAHKAVDELLDRLDLWLPEVTELPFFTGVQRKWRRAIEYRARQLARR
jgi:HipA-like C-terminal domain